MIRLCIKFFVRNTIIHWFWPPNRNLNTEFIQPQSPLFKSTKYSLKIPTPQISVNLPYIISGCRPKQRYYRCYISCSHLLLNPLNAELNPICYLLALLGAHHFLHVSRIRVKSLTFRLRMSYIYIYIYGAPILDVSRSHTTTHHSR